jgi:hypothetical protein
MAPGRNILATTLLVVGIVLGAVLAGIWFDLSWAELVAGDPQGSNTMRHLSGVIRGGLVIWCVVAWPFIWLAGRLA